MILLSGCASKQETHNNIPPVLTQDCHQHVLPEGDVTYKDVIEGYLEQSESISECNLRLEAIRQLNK